jgi:hypothetical protein
MIAHRLAEARRHKRRILELHVRPLLLKGRVTHIHGPARVDYGARELITITVVRNGASYVDPFLEHHRRLGVKHLVFLDNGSADETVAMLSRHPDTTVLRSSAPYATFENSMKTYLARRFSRGRWNLCVDIDELFDYPFSSTLRLPEFLAYLDNRRFTAVVAQMLDMFADRPITDSVRGAAMLNAHEYYDVSAIEKSDYTWSEASNPAIRMHWGGIRRTVFGTNNGLTKAALVKMEPGVVPFNVWHHATGARVADVSCLLRHYPFAAAFVDKVNDAVETGRYGATTTGEYASYRAGLERDPRLTLKRATAKRFSTTDALVDEGFLVVSDEYRRVAGRAR